MRPSITLALLFVSLAASGTATATATATAAQEHAAGAAPAHTAWLSVLLGGRKIGSLKIERSTDGHTVTTTQTLDVTLDRIGQKTPMQSVNRTIEDLDGTPLGFYSRQRLSSMDITVEGTPVAPNQFRVITHAGGAPTTSMLEIPPHVLMLDGLRRTLAAANKRTGDHYMVQQFDPSSRQVMTVSIRVLGDETVMLPDGRRTLTHQREELLHSGAPQSEDLWLDDDGNVVKGRVELLGQPLEMIACSKACAMAPSQPLDMFRQAVVASPRWLPQDMRGIPLTYYVHISGSSPHGGLISTDEQWARPLGHNNWRIDVGRFNPGKQAPPGPGDLGANEWLQSDAPEIRALAVQAVGKASSPLAKMRRLRNFVSNYVTQHGLDIGYASALEVARTRRGDCTEYAVLLAALARAQGIPTRVVSGIAYAGRAAGALRVFVPHAWTQAWIDGRWQSFDAALGQFDSGHIALATSDGSPASFFQSSRLFGRLRIDQVNPGGASSMPSAIPPPPPPATNPVR
jgi:hypothetical protein